MTKEELLKCCKYYKGEKECPLGNAKGEIDPETGKHYQNMQMFWSLERIWVNNGGEISDGAKDYEFLAKRQKRKPVEGIPISLLGVIHFVWGKGGASEDLDLFEKFIREEYL